MWILRNAPASPFGRKVRIAAALCGLDSRIEIVIADTTDPADPLRGQNPLGKIPTLILEDGTALYDSRVIVEFLDAEAGGGVIIPAGAARFRGLDDAGARRRREGCLAAAGLRGAVPRAGDPQPALAGQSARQGRARARDLRGEPAGPFRRSRMSGRSPSPARSATKICASRENGARPIRASSPGSTILRRKSRALRRRGRAEPQPASKKARARARASCRRCAMDARRQNFRPMPPRMVLV